MWLAVIAEGDATAFIEQLLLDPLLGASESGRAALEQMSLLMSYCSLLNISDFVSFDLSLARGLDYYTGVIYEATLQGE